MLVKLKLYSSSRFRTQATTNPGNQRQKSIAPTAKYPNTTTTKVKRLFAYQSGRLESILLPVLVTAASVIPPKRQQQPLIESGLAALDIGSNKQQRQDRALATGGNDMLFNGFLKKEKEGNEYACNMTEIDLDDVPIVIKNELVS